MNCHASTKTSFALERSERVHQFTKHIGTAANNVNSAGLHYGPARAQRALCEYDSHRRSARWKESCFSQLNKSAAKDTFRAVDDGITGWPRVPV